MPRWHDVSAEPNSREAKRYRLDALAAAHRKPVRDRVACLAELATGKRVLDVGVVAHTADLAATAGWLHREIAKSAAYCLGVDILEADVKKLRDAGFNVRCADITRDDLGEQFDIMIAGEVIEHLGSPEKLFDAAKRHLLPGGRLVITTPNPYYWKRMRNHLWRWYRRNESVDHVLFAFPSAIAELAERAGMRLDAYRGIYSGGMTGLKRFLGSFLVQSEVFCETLVYECII